MSGPDAERILSQAFRPLSSHAHAGEGVLQLGRIVADGEVIDEAVISRRGQTVEINIHGGSLPAKRAMELLTRLGATACPAHPAAPETFQPAHPKWNNPAIGAEMLEVLPLAKSAFVAASVTNQWSAGVSELARSGDDPVALRSAAGALCRMRRLLHPAEVVIAGAPNVGKSTLANALVGRRVSIVHSRAGTTRDWVRQLAILDGVPVWLTDTAGLWDAPDAIDAEAVRRAIGRLREADLVLLTGSAQPSDEPKWCAGKPVLRVAARCDLSDAYAGADVAVSAHTGEGLAKLRGAILAKLDLGGLHATAPMAFTDRQADLLFRGADALERGDHAAAREALRRLLEG